MAVAIEERGTKSKVAPLLEQVATNAIDRTSWVMVEEFINN